MAAVEALFTPVELGELKLKNRFVMASLTRARSGPTRVPGDLNVEHYRARAAHFGLLLTEATAVSPYGEGWNGTPSIYTEEHAAGWKRVVDAVHEEGGLIGCQLWFMGRAGHSSFLPEGEETTWSASNLPITNDQVHTKTGEKVPYETPRPMTIEEIHQAVESYGKAAELAKGAGFDCVELHGANGYLIDQFLQSGSNQRTDEYGGSKENRVRFLKEILDRVTKVYPGGRVGIKLSPNGAYNGMGSEDNNETFNHVFEVLNPYNLAYAQVMDTVFFGHHGKCPPQSVESFRDIYKGNFMINCGYTPETAGEKVAKGVAAAAAFGRPTMSNPDYPARVRNGWPIAETIPMSIWYGTPTNPLEVGYTDQPTYKP